MTVKSKRIQILHIKTFPFSTPAPAPYYIKHQPHINLSQLKNSIKKNRFSFSITYMSPISADDLHRIFKNLDKKNKGLVGIEELQRLLEQIGVHTTAEELEKFVGRTSLDYIEFFFFYEAMVKARKVEHEHEHDLLKAFEVFDLNRDGYISCEELQSVLSRLGLLDKRSGEDCKDMISVYDHNSDGVLDFAEFKNMMMMTVPPSSDSHI